MAEYDLMAFAEAMVADSGGRLRIAHSEQDDTREPEKEAASFFKLDGKRLGRDIELYHFMGASIMGWPATIVDLVMEVLLPIKDVVPASYGAGRAMLLRWGRAAYTAEQYQEFVTLF